MKMLPRKSKTINFEVKEIGDARATGLIQKKSLGQFQNIYSDELDPKDNLLRRDSPKQVSRGLVTEKVEPDTVEFQRVPSLGKTIEKNMQMMNERGQKELANLQETFKRSINQTKLENEKLISNLLDKQKEELKTAEEVRTQERSQMRSLHEGQLRRKDLELEAARESLARERQKASELRIQLETQKIQQDASERKLQREADQLRHELEFERRQIEEQKREYLEVIEQLKKQNAPQRARSTREGVGREEPLLIEKKKVQLELQRSELEEEKDRFRREMERERSDLQVERSRLAEQKSLIGQFERKLNAKEEDMKKRFEEVDKRLMADTAGGPRAAERGVRAQEQDPVADDTGARADAQAAKNGAGAQKGGRAAGNGPFRVREPKDAVCTGKRKF